jgi:hypothetical protein
MRRRSGLDQLCRAEGCGDGIRIAGAGEDLDGGVGELDHVRVSVPDRPDEGVPGRLLAGMPAARRFRQLSPPGGLSRSVDSTP